MSRIAPERSQLVIYLDLLFSYVATDNRCFQLGYMRLLRSSQLTTGSGQYSVDVYGVGIGGSHSGAVNLRLRGNGSAKKINGAKEQGSTANYNNLLFVQARTF